MKNHQLLHLLEKFKLQQGDILSLNLDSINNKITKVIANIPYNITGPILEIFIGKLGLVPKHTYKKIIFLQLELEKM